MIKYKKELVETTNEYKYCDNCKSLIESYGCSNFELAFNIEPFRDECGESRTYHFCCFECLKKFITMHKPVNIASPEFEVII